MTDSQSNSSTTNLESTGPKTTSPLGERSEVDAVRIEYPAIAGLLDDLERVITPEFHRADHEAMTAQRAIKRARLIEMCGGAIVTTLAIVGLARDEWVWAAIGGLFAGLTATVAATRSRRQLESWLDQRRIAEELRSLYFTILTSSTQKVTAEGVDRRRQIRTVVDEIVAPEWVLAADDAASFTNHSAGPVSATPWAIYRDFRLRNQIEWTKAKSETVKSRSVMLGHVQLTLLVSAAFAGVLIFVLQQTSGEQDGLTTWLAVVVAASAGLVSLAAAADSVVASERLAEHYSRTVRRLELIERTLDDDVGSTGDVKQIESVLLAEHRAWHRITQGNNQ